jgi:hypothetical protein
VRQFSTLVLMPGFHSYRVRLDLLTSRFAHHVRHLKDQRPNDPKDYKTPKGSKPHNTGNNQ